MLDTVVAALLHHALPEGSKLLKEQGVAHVRQLAGEDLGAFLDAAGAPDPPDHIIYLVRASMQHMQLIAAQILARAKTGAASFDFRYQVQRVGLFTYTPATRALHLSTLAFI